MFISRTRASAIWVVADATSAGKAASTALGNAAVLRKTGDGAAQGKKLEETQTEPSRSSTAQLGADSLSASSADHLSNVSNEEVTGAAGKQYSGRVQKLITVGYMEPRVCAILEGELRQKDLMMKFIVDNHLAKQISSRASALSRREVKRALFEASPALAAVLGKRFVTFVDGQKLIWKYIKENDLQHIEAPLCIVPDERLREVFSGAEMTSFGHVSRYLKCNLSPVPRSSEFINADFKQAPVSHP